MNNRPETRLFMLMSVDGKISTGDSDELDVDTDFSELTHVKEGLHQYYELEQTTDLFSLNTGRVFEKIGVNEQRVFQNGVPVTYILVDNKPHLTAEGIAYLAEKAQGLFVISTNPEHPAKLLSDSDETIKFLFYSHEIDFEDAFFKLREYGVEKMTIQSGGTLNATLLRKGLIDTISIVVAPVLIGGTNTASLIGGESLHTKSDLIKLRPLELISCTKLENSYLHLEYKVLNS